MSRGIILIPKQNDALYLSIGAQTGPPIGVQKGPFEYSACEQSVAAEPSRRVDRLEFGEVEFADRAQRLGSGGVLERVG